ncbi:MAG: aldo/keto reductase [Chloroflexota bacterium]|nr:aldo/keto reductase [Chloroflexota bacterium]
MTNRLAWGIIGTGNIAKTFARGLRGSRTGQLVAVGSRSQEGADKFGQEFDAPNRHGSYEALLADPQVQAVYISTPHPMHAEWAIKAADAGKHVLCEKPLGLNYPEAMAVVEAARRNDVFLMEAFMYRCHPQTARLVELIEQKAIGDVRVIDATFSFNAAYNPEARLFNPHLGGGGILDVGCYCTSAARLIAGAATHKPFAEPTEVKGTGYLDPRTGVDMYAVASLAFPEGIVAKLSTGVQVSQESVLRVYGSEGSITVPSPWIPAKEGGTSTLLLYRKGAASPEEITVESDAPLYSLEADTVAACLDKREAAPPAMTWEDSLGNMRTLDAWRDSIGLVYPMERPEAQPGPVHGRPLRVSAEHNMKYGRIEGLDKPVSRLVMGVDNQRTMPFAAIMFDDFFERGGNVFDSAYIYGGGRQERLLGQWVKSRGVRDQVVILDKGAHTPFCTPEFLSSQLLESLERLQMEYVDIYMMHRDNPAYPVSAFIDVLNEHQRAGRMRIFGASNWSIERVEEANRYAAANGLSGFSAMSNNFSLARMVQPPWAGSISTADPASREWFTRTQMPLMPWSSQARGFFTGRAHPDDHSDTELVRTWYSDDNFQRLERVNELAAQRGVLPINIALAYVLNQPFPTFPLIGPRALSETRTSLTALDIDLTPDELRWLNLED